MAQFDIGAARKAGYSDEEIASFLGQKSGFDVEGARAAGYTDGDIVTRLSQGPRKATNLERAMAVPAGVNKTAYAYLPGLPVDTVANVLDLGKAGIGYLTSKVTGDAPPDWTVPMDRRRVVGSSEWIADKINAGADALDVRSPIDNPAPQDEAARILYSGGMLGGSAIVPNPRARIGAIDQVRNAGMGTVGGLLSGAVAEESPEWAGVATFAPHIGLAATAAATKGAFRGGEKGRKEMEQRIQTFKNAGVDQPSAGLASGNGFVQGVENLLSLTPGSVGVFERAKQRMTDGMQARANQVRDYVSPVHGPVEAGSAIQADLKGAFKDRIGRTYGLLSDDFAAALPQNQRFPIPSTLSALDGATAVNPAAPATSAGFVQPRIAGLRSNIMADTSVTLPGVYKPTRANQGLPID